MSKTEIIVIDDLTTLPAQINAAIQDTREHTYGVVQSALRAGQLLLQAKAAVPHGQWETWLQDHCSVAPRTAQVYMRFCTKFPELPTDKRNGVALLPLREAIKAITTAPTAPPRVSAWVSMKKTEAEKTAMAMRASADAIRKMARYVDQYGVTIKRVNLEQARRKIQHAADLIDRLLADAEVAE